MPRLGAMCSSSSRGTLLRATAVPLTSTWAPSSVTYKTCSEAVKVQAAPSPMQRHFLMHQAYSARGVALEYIDSTRHIEVEQLEEIRRPKSRFSQAVRHAVFDSLPDVAQGAVLRPRARAPPRFCVSDTWTSGTC